MTSCSWATTSTRWSVPSRIADRRPDRRATVLSCDPEGSNLGGHQDRDPWRCLRVIPARSYRALAMVVPQSNPADGAFTIERRGELTVISGTEQLEHIE